MADYFLEVSIESDAQTLADQAVERLTDQWLDWVPNDADLEVVMIEALAGMAQNAAETAARVPGAIFRAFGTELLRVAYETGQPALGALTFSLLTTDGHIIPAGTEVEVDGMAFATDDDVLVPAGQNVATGVPATAMGEGTVGNDLTGVVVELITALAFVEMVTLVGPTAGGMDAEDDPDYEDRLSRQLELQATTLVTTRDFELMAKADPDVGRVLAKHDGARRVEVTLTDIAGESVAQVVKDRLVARYAEYRMVNTTVTMVDPTYTTVGVTWTVQAYPGFDAVDLKARINAMLADFLSPGTYGRPKVIIETFAEVAPEGGSSGPDSWLNEPLVRVYKLVDLIGDVDGVDYVASITISSPTAVADASGNLPLAGSTPLPRPGVMTGTVTPA